MKMRTLILIIISTLASLASAQCHGHVASVCASAHESEANCCPSNSASCHGDIISVYLDKLKDAYVNQDLGFIMSILNVDSSEMNDLYNEFMDEDIRKVEIADVKISPADGDARNNVSSSFKLLRSGYNFSDIKYVTILWDISNPISPKIINVISKNG